MVCRQTELGREPIVPHLDLQATGKERGRDTGLGFNIRNFKASDRPPRTRPHLLTVPFPGDKAFKSVSLWGPFLFRLLQYIYAFQLSWPQLFGSANTFFSYFNMKRKSYWKGLQSNQLAKVYLERLLLCLSGFYPHLWAVASCLILYSYFSFFFR